MSNIPKDDLLTVGVDIPESYNKWTKRGTTKLTGWPKEVEMTFCFDFTGVPLEDVFNLAVGALVIDTRPALKKEGFEFCRENPTVNINVAERKKRGPAQPRNLAAQIAKSIENGTIKDDLKNVSREDLESYLEAIQQVINSSQN
jgi:hypothetical protein